MENKSIWKESTISDDHIVNNAVTDAFPNPIAVGVTHDESEDLKQCSDMEKRTEVKTYKVELVCENCDEGTMESCDGAVLTTHPAQYPHKCTECGTETHITGTTYPYMEYK